jgi:UDP-N-acetylmuramate dehydrogenase
MEDAAFEAALVALLGADRVARNVPLARVTTFKVGGPADWLAEPKSADETVAALRVAHEAGVQVTVLGGGSNVLVGDRGIRGLVLRPRGGVVRAADDGTVRADGSVTLNGLVRWTITHG